MFITLDPRKLTDKRLEAGLPRTHVAERAKLDHITLMIVEEMDRPLLVPRIVVDRLINALGGGFGVAELTVVPDQGFPVELVEPYLSDGVNGFRSCILERDEERCVYCGSRRNLTVDHVVPAARGGPLVEGNLVASCRRCNHLKGDSVPSEIGFTIARPTMNRLKAWWQGME